jgi:hypothetical protein
MYKWENRWVIISIFWICNKCTYCCYWLTEIKWKYICSLEKFWNIFADLIFWQFLVCDFGPSFDLFGSYCHAIVHHEEVLLFPYFNKLFFYIFELFFAQLKCDWLGVFLVLFVFLLCFLVILVSELSLLFIFLLLELKVLQLSLQVQKHLMDLLVDSVLGLFRYQCGIVLELCELVGLLVLDEGHHEGSVLLQVWLIENSTGLFG